MNNILHKGGKFCLALSLVLAIVFSLFALSTSATQGRKQTVRIGVFEMDGFYGEDLGKPRGYGYDYLEGLAPYANLDYEYVHASWADCLDMLERGEIDILDAVQDTPERRERFLYSDFPSGSSCAMLTVRADNDSIAFNDFEALDGLRIGLFQGNNNNISLQQYVRENGVTILPVLYGSETELEDALQSGQVDAILTSSFRQITNERVVARFDPRPFYLVLPSDRTDLLETINRAQAQVQIYKPELQNMLARKYFQGDSSAVVLTRQELDYIANCDTIRLVYDSQWPPFEYYDPEKETATGLNVDLFHHIAGETGLEFEFLHGYSYDEALAMVASGESDMLLSYDTNPQKAQELDILLSDTFLETPIALIGRDYNLLSSSSFAISDMHPLAYDYIRDRFPASSITRYPSIEECYRAVEQGKADFTAENIYAATEAIKSGAWGDLIIASVTTMKDRFSFAFTGDTDERLVGIFNKFIADFSMEEKDSLLLTYSANLATSQGLELFVKRYRTELLGVASVLLLLIALALVLIVLQQKKNRRRLWELAYLDPLTALPNRNQLSKKLGKVLQAHPDQRHLLLQIDVNKFNLINQLYGFEEGDRVLCLIRDTLLRYVDAERDMLVRTHGDNFILLLSTRTEEEIAQVYHQDPLLAFRTSLAEESSHKLHFTVGRYLISLGETDVGTILEKVNYAHNSAKRKGILNLPYEYDDDLKQTAIRQRDIESKMDDALKNRDFVVYLQGKYNLSDQSLQGAEALVRWTHFEGDAMLSPIEFIPLFEKNGFVLSLDFYMFRRVCEILKNWQETGQPLLSISVNFSRLHLQNARFVEQLVEIAEELEAPREYIEVELTESAILENEEGLEQLIHKLHEAGFAFAMDDFGTGYSSLGLLKNLSVDTLKIDRSFFEGSQANTRAGVVLEHIIHMAKELGMHSVAEGVETEAHVEFLRDIGCEIAQGYYFARPIPVEDFSTQPRHENKTGSNPTH